MFSTDCKLWFSPAKRDLIDTSPLIRFQWGSGLDDMVVPVVKIVGQQWSAATWTCTFANLWRAFSNASPQWWSWGATRRPNVSQILSHAPWAPWPLWAYEGRTQVVAISPSPNTHTLFAPGKVSFWEGYWYYSFSRIYISSDLIKCTGLWPATKFQRVKEVVDIMATIMATTMATTGAGSRVTRCASQTSKMWDKHRVTGASQEEEGKSWRYCQVSRPQREVIF